MLVIYEMMGERCFLEASHLRVSDEMLKIDGGVVDVRLKMGDGWTKDLAVKSIDRQLTNPLDDTPYCQVEIYLVNIQKPHHAKR